MMRTIGFVDNATDRIWWTSTPNANAKQVSTHKKWDEAGAWMQQDKANRVVEVVQMGVHVCMGGHHKQVEWERVDKSKPFGFGWSGVSGWERNCSMLKVPPWQCPGSAPVPPQGTSGGSGQLLLGTPSNIGSAE